MAGLHMTRGNFSSWRAYRSAHQANLLSFLQLSKLTAAAALPTGECVEVNVVHPGGGRWLPRPLRRMLHTDQGAALTATFLASTPVMGMSGLYFEDFASRLPWSKSVVSLRARGMLRESFQVGFESDALLAHVLSLDPQRTAHPGNVMPGV